MSNPCSPSCKNEHAATPELFRLLAAAVSWYTATVSPTAVARVELYERERVLRLAIREAHKAATGRDL